MNLGSGPVHDAVKQASRKHKMNGRNGLAVLWVLVVSHMT
jgi:hypothetical protein